MTAAYAALVAANYDALPDLIARIDTAFEQDPNNSRLALYAGTMRLWLATGGSRPVGNQFSDVLQAIEALERGRESNPKDPHVGAFLGIAHVAFANVTRDEDRLAKGKQILEETVPLYPAYVNGVLAQALGMVPRDHALFAGAADAIRASFKACGYDADALDTLSFEYPKGPTQGTCWNGGVVAHVTEGISLIGGDIFVKQGDVESARLMYQNAKQSPTYDRWPFGAELDRRIEQADARAALYLDADHDNDPPTWMQEHNLCVGCHANKP